MLGIPNVLAPITDVFPTILDILASVKTILLPIADVLSIVSPLHSGCVRTWLRSLAMFILGRHPRRDAETQ
jgi:hypothetical protein